MNELQVKKHKKYNKKAVTSNVKQYKSWPTQGYQREKEPTKSNNMLQVFFIHGEHQKDGKWDEKSQIDQTKADPPVMASAGKIVFLVVVLFTPMAVPLTVDNLRQLDKQKTTPDVNHHGSVWPKKCVFPPSHQIHKGNVNEETSCNGQNPCIGLLTMRTDGHTNEESEHRSERRAEVEKKGSEPVDATLQQNGIITCGMYAGVTKSAKESPVTPFFFVSSTLIHIIFFHSSHSPSVVSPFYYTHPL